MPGGHAPVSAAGPTEEWISAIRAAAKHPKVFCKISHLVRSALHEARPPGTTELDFYRPYLDVVWEAFGEDRVIYASNWPVSESISDYDALERIPLRHAFEKGEAATRKFCSLNSQRAYRWAERPGRRLPLGGVAQAQNNDAVTAGEFIIEPATIHNLGFEWKISGDDNRNATVAVQYRRQGESQWREAMPLLRIGDEKVWRVREFLEYRTPRMFAGSILDLDEATAYECRFTMSDPDGVSGTATQQVTVTTRSTPKIYTKGRTLHVYPPDYEGPKQEPSFKGLKEAYYGPGPGDWDVVHTRPVQPGDVILVHAGLYKADRMNYVTPYGVPFDGTYILTRDGTPEKPIVIKGAGDGEVIFDGDGCFRLFDVMGADYNYFEGITIRNTDVAFYSGHKDLLGNSGLVVRNCRIEDVGVAVMNEYAGSKKFYIADNVILGRDDRNRIIGWQHFGKYKPTQLKSYYAIKVYGQGHVICHNYIAYFHDGVCISSQPHKVYEPGDMDFSLKPNSKAVDAGCRLPNVNDDFTGKAPDLDALEVGKPQTIYGPRQ